MAEIKNYTLNFGPQHPAAHGVADTLGVGIGSIAGTFYVLDPSMRTGTSLPLRYA